jgi:N-methylhydantoinase A/oxoprolinase/acetone carboxylase beta subunit
VTVEWDPLRPLTDLAERFHLTHRQRYGDADRGRVVEIVSIRVAATKPGVSPQLVLPGEVDLPPAGPAVVAMHGATGWLADGWRARTTDTAVLLER